MQPLLRSEFDGLHKDPFKRFRTYIIQNIIKFRKERNDSNYFSIFNIAYFHIIFSFVFFFLPFSYFFINVIYICEDFENIFEKIIKEKSLNIKDLNSLIFHDLDNIKIFDNKKEINGLIESFDLTNNNINYNILKPISSKYYSNSNYIYNYNNNNYNFNKNDKSFYSDNFNKSVYMNAKDQKINFNYLLPQLDIGFNFINNLNLLEDFLFEFFNESKIKDTLNLLYFSTLILITFLITILFFKLIDCIYFLKMQSWRMTTLYNIMKYLIWNICILFLIIKFHNTFYKKENFSIFFTKIKSEIFYSDSLNRKKFGISESIFFNFLNKKTVKIFLYNLTFRILFYFLSKFLLVNFLKFYFMIKFILFIIFRNKYTLLFSLYYIFLFLLIFLNFDFFCFFQNENYYICKI